MSLLRLLFSSNAMWIGSGYGVQGQSLLPRLANLPEFGGRRSIAQFAWCGLEGGVIDYLGFRIYPRQRHLYGNDAIGPHSRDFGANWVVTLIDTWVLDKTAESVAPSLWTPYLPIDMTPVPAPVLQGIEGCHLPIIFSKWGQAEMTKVGVESLYIPLGLETGAFRILPEDEVSEFRRATLLDPEHLSIMVAANKSFPDRKFFQGQMRAWAAFAKDKPGARLYIHTDPTGLSGGLDIISLARSIGILDKCMFPKPDQYNVGYPTKYMALLYNAADVFLGAAMGEGFGIPIIEAEACGTPVIVTNFSSMPELVRWGTAVPMADIYYSLLGSWQAWPDVQAITDALHAYYAEWEADGRQKNYDKRKVVQDAIHEEYGWNVIVRDYWQPLAQRMAQECPPLDGRFQVGVPSVQSNGLHKLPVTPVDIPPKLKWLGPAEGNEVREVEIEAQA